MRHLYLVILVRPRPRGRPLPGPRSRGVGGSLALQATAATYLRSGDRRGYSRG